MTPTETMPQPEEVSTGGKIADNASNTHSGSAPRMSAESPVMNTDELITLVRRAPALAALREQPLDRRDLQECLGVSKPTVHRLTGTLTEKGLLERSNGIFVLTRLGETVADVVASFTRDVETTYRLAPLLGILDPADVPPDVTVFTGATVTTASPADPYAPLRRYCSLVEETETLRGFETTMFPPRYLDTGHQQIRDGMETQVMVPSSVIAHIRSMYPEQRTELVGSANFDIRIHDDISYGLAIFDERIGVSGHCETTGALRMVIDTDSPAAREWAKDTYDSYWHEAESISE